MSQKPVYTTTTPYQVKPDTTDLSVGYEGSPTRKYKNLHEAIMKQLTTINENLSRIPQYQQMNTGSSVASLNINRQSVQEPEQSLLGLDNIFKRDPNYRPSHNPELRGSVVNNSGQLNPLTLSNQNLLLQSESYRYREQILSHRGDTLPSDMPYTSNSVRHHVTTDNSHVINTPTRQLFSPPKSKPEIQTGKDQTVAQSIQVTASTGEWKSLEETLNKYQVGSSEEIRSPYFNSSVNNQSDDRVGQAIKAANQALLNNSEVINSTSVNKSGGGQTFSTFGNGAPKKRETSPENSNSALRIGPQLSFGLPLVTKETLEEGETSRRSGNQSKEGRGRASIELLDLKEAREKSKSRDRSENSRPLTPNELRKKLTIDPNIKELDTESRLTTETKKESPKHEPKESPKGIRKLSDISGLDMNATDLDPTKLNNLLNFASLRPNIPFPMTNGQPMNPADLQGYVIFVMNFYEMHMSNLKSLVLKQNETIVANKRKIRANDETLKDMRKKFDSMDQEFKSQGDNYQKSYDDLRSKHDKTLDEILAYKASAQAREAASKEKTAKDAEHQDKLILDELQNIKKDIESQKVVIGDFKNVRSTLETQIKDLEKTYLDELKKSSEMSLKNEHQIIKSFHDNLAMDRLNKMIMEGYERTRKDVENLRNLQSESDALSTEDRDVVPNLPSQGTFSPKRYDRSYKPSVREEPKKVPRETQRTTVMDTIREEERNVDRYNKRMDDDRLFDRSRKRSPQQSGPDPTEESHAIYEQIRNKNKGTSDILSWGGKKGSVNSYETNYGASHKNSQPEIDYSHNRQREYVNNNSSNSYTQRAGNTPEKHSHGRARVQQAPSENPITHGSSQKAYGVMPSYQKFESNKDEIKFYENELLDLNQNRKKVENIKILISKLENELFKMPKHPGNLEIRRRKGVIEQDLEDIDLRIDEAKNRLRKLGVLNIR